MPATALTDEIKMDFRLLKHRNALNRDRHYKRDNSEIPKYFQVGTVIEGATDFLNGRISKKNRKRTITEEILADHENIATIKSKFLETQDARPKRKKPFVPPKYGKGGKFSSNKSGGKSKFQRQ